MKKSLMLLCIGGAAVAAGAPFDERDAMAPLPAGAVRLSGGLEEPILRSIASWHKGKVPYHEFAEFFRKGRPKFALGEMWGKFVRSGAMQYRHVRDPELKAVLDAACRRNSSREGTERRVRIAATCWSGST